MKGLDEMTVGKSAELDVMIMNLGEEFEIDKSLSVAEVFSMPRVLPIAERKGVTGMRSYDIGNGWNFLLESHRKKCREEISKHRRQVVLVVLLVVPFPK